MVLGRIGALASFRRLERLTAFYLQLTSDQLPPHLAERLHSSDDEAAWNDRDGEGFRMPAGGAERLGVGRRTETAHARTRGGVQTVYGDLRVLRRRRRQNDDSDLQLSGDAEQLRSVLRTGIGQCPGEKQSDAMVIGMAGAGAGAQLPDGRSRRASARS
jgi:hypothetical protein